MTMIKTVIVLISGVALGAAAVQSLHAQAKPKAYTIAEVEVLDAAALKTYLAKANEANLNAGARSLRTAGGKIVAMKGEAPKRVAITEFDSLEQAEAFYHSKAYQDLNPLREKAVRTIKRYAVEALP